MSQPQARLGMHAQPRKAIVNQLRTECRRNTDLEQRAERAERAERDLTIQLQRARERISALKDQVAELGAQRDRAAISFAGGTAAVIARMRTTGSDGGSS